MRWFVSLLVLLAGVASAADTQTFTDDLGRAVTVPCTRSALCRCTIWISPFP